MQPASRRRDRLGVPQAARAGGAGAAARRACFDDLHWAEETLLDLVEHVADLSRDAPILLLCMARPELLERRPSWGGGKWNATTVLLEPLDAAETEQLLAELGGVAAGAARADRPGRPRATRSSSRRCSRWSATGGGSRCRRRSRRCSRRGSTSSTRPSARCSSAERSRAASSTAARSRRCRRRRQRRPAARRAGAEGAGPSRPAQLPGDDAYRFRHLLIRDAAYDALPKAMRADLHERFAAWLEEHGRDWSSSTRSSATTSNRPRVSRRARAEDPRLRSPRRRLGARGQARVLTWGRPARRRGPARTSLRPYATPPARHPASGRSSRMRSTRIDVRASGHEGGRLCGGAGQAAAGDEAGAALARTGLRKRSAPHAGRRVPPDELERLARAALWSAARGARRRRRARPCLARAWDGSPTCRVRGTRVGQTRLSKRAVARPHEAPDIATSVARYSCACTLAMGGPRPAERGAGKARFLDRRTGPPRKRPS